MKARKKHEGVVAGIRAGIEAGLLGFINAFPLFVGKMRDGDLDLGPMLVDKLIRLLLEADSAKADLSGVAISVQDLFYLRVVGLDQMDEHTRTFCKVIAALLFDQLRVRGVKTI